MLWYLNTTFQGLYFHADTFQGWWLGKDDNRVSEPYISPERWEQELLRAGFHNPRNIGYDGQFNANMIASSLPLTAPAKRLSLLLDTERIPFIDEVKTSFLNQGYEVDECNISQIPPPNQDVVSLLDFGCSFFHDITAEKFDEFKRFLSNLGSAGILWVTKPSQIESDDPRYSAILGLARTIRIETPLDMATLELDSTDRGGLDAVMKVFGKFRSRQPRGSDAELDPDYEFALKEDLIYTSRFSFISVKNALSPPIQDQAPRKLTIGKRGFLQTLQFVQYDLSPLDGDCVEVEMRAVGLNFQGTCN